MENISYLEYIKILEEKKIILYDYHKRISYHRLKNLSQIIPQKGGDNKKLKIIEKNTIEKILNLENRLIEKILLDLLYKDFNDINNILELYT